MVLGEWYFGKRLLILVSIAITLSAFWFIYSNRQYIFSVVFPATNGSATPVPTQLKKEARKYPFMAFLIFQHANGSVNCGGTLIGKRHILTAAHCLQGASSVYIILGSDNILIEEKSVLYLESSTFIVHEFFDNATYDNDIALICLKDEVSMNENVNAISFFSSNNVTADNTSFVVLGWGLIDSEQGLNDRLLVKIVSVVDDVICLLSMEEEESASKICALGESGPCHGDSGGPLLFGDVQIGIVSGGDEECRATVPTVYTNVSFYWQWIKKQTFSSSSNEINKNN